MPAPRGGRRLRSETTTTGTCPAISGTTQYSPCFECLRLVDLSLLNLAHSSQTGGVRNEEPVSCRKKIGKSLPNPAIPGTRNAEL